MLLMVNHVLLNYEATNVFQGDCQPLVEAITNHECLGFPSVTSLKV